MKCLQNPISDHCADTLGGIFPDHTVDKIDKKNSYKCTEVRATCGQPLSVEKSQYLSLSLPAVGLEFRHDSANSANTLWNRSRVESISLQNFLQVFLLAFLISLLYTLSSSVDIYQSLLQQNCFRVSDLNSDRWLLHKVESLFF